MAFSLALASFCLPALAAGPYPANMCVGTRSGNLGCASNDVAVAAVEVTNGVTSCVAGSTVDVGLRVKLQSNANSRYDLGIFVARDGRPPELDIASGGSVDCAVFGVPTNPAPLADLNGNACGDLQKSNQVAVVDLGTVSVLCLPDQSGNLKLPATVTWEQNANGSCRAPPAAWVEATTPSKCNAAEDISVPVQVVGSLTIVKQTLPAASAGSFAFSATGSAPASFTLAHGQQRVLTTGALTTSPTVVTVTESLLGGFDPAADIACTTADGGPAGFVTIDRANRRVTASLTAANSRATCTFTNKAEGRIRVVKQTTSADGSFAFAGDVPDFSITTSGGRGQRELSGLAAGRYAITELVPPKWTLVDILCVDPSGGTTVKVAAKTALVDLAAGELVTCTFTNRPTSGGVLAGVINVVKKTTGGDGAFPFSAQVGGAQDFTLATSGGTSPTKSFTRLPPGTYTVTELVPAGWSLASIACDDPTGNSGGAGETATVNLADGETVTCTFSNRRNASVVIQKFTEGGDGTFDFNGTASFAITTRNGFGEDATTFASIRPGESFSYTEAVPAGWEFTGTTCKDAVTGAAVGAPLPNGRVFVPTAGQQVLCTVNNRRMAQLTIVEVSTPKSGQAFAYTATGAGLSDFSLADDGSGNNRRVFTVLAPGGAYRVAQGAAAGWTTTAIQCSDRLAPDPANRTAVDLVTRTVTPNLQPGESLTCTFYNAQAAAGSIDVVKEANGGDGAFAFANSGGAAGSPTNPQAFTVTTSSGSGSRQLTALAAGTYTITETVPSGWLAPPAVQCTVLSGTSTTITPVAGGARIDLGTTGGAVDSVRCTFENTRAARITIVEDATPDAAQAFAYAATGTGVPASFSLTNDGAPAPADRRFFENLGAGAYRFTVTNPAGWRLTAIRCTGNAATTVDVAKGQADVTLAAGEDVTCTYRHSREATLAITKTAANAAAGDRFAFTGPATLSGNYAAGETRTVSLAPGIHVVTEAVPDGWSLTNIACTGGQWTFTGAPGGGPGFEPGDTTANITIAAGESVACTFTNAKDSPPKPEANGVIRVVKSSVGGDGSFPFRAQVGTTQAFTLTTANGTSPMMSFTSLGAGTYTVTELVPPGWTLASIACADPTGDSGAAGATATINLADGETVTCTFTDTAAASIVVEKVAVGGDDTFAFAGSASFSVTTASGAGRDAGTFANVAAGAPVTITEAAPPGWLLSAAACRDAATGVTAGTAIAGGVRVTPVAGQRVTCTFTNTRLAQLTLVEVSVPKAAQLFSYATTGPGLADFTLVDDGSGTNRRAFTDLVPGQAYAVTQAAAPGWSTPFIVCSDRLAADAATRTPVDLAGRTVTPNLQPGEKLVCVFVNAQPAAGSITVAKVANGGDASFDFTNSGGAAGSATNPAAFAIVTASGAGARTLTGLAPGTYTIAEVPPADWLAPPSVQCSVLSGSSTTITPFAGGITLQLGQTGAAVDSVACTFDNTKAGRITIVEDATPDAAQAFAYTATGAGVPAAFTLVNDGSPAPADRGSFAGLAAGEYRFQATSPAGWRLTAITCTGGTASTSVADGRATVALAAGDEVTCVFRHAREGTLSLTKSAAGAVSGDTFTFTGPPGLAGDYASGQTRSSALAPGSYALAEIIPAGWTISNIACTGGTVIYTGAAAAATDAFEPGDNTAEVRIAAGETVACTFSNARAAPATGTIVVRKESVGGFGLFAFTGAEDFQIDTRSRRVPEHEIALPPGTHVVQEVVPTGWRLTGLACSGTSTVDLATATATVTLAAGERVRCTYTDEKLGRIEIVKAIRGEQTADFAFSVPSALEASGRIVLSPTLAQGEASRAFVDVPAGAYAVTELPPPSGFRLLSIACSDPTGDSAADAATGVASIRLAPGETVRCTYTNTTTATITLGAVSFQGEGRFTFLFESTVLKAGETIVIETSPLNPEASFGREIKGGLAPTLYTVTAQASPPGWTFSYTQCVSSSGEQHWTINGNVTAITLPDGENVRCYYFYVPSAAVAGPVPVPALAPAGLLLLSLLLAGLAWALHRKR